MASGVFSCATVLPPEAASRFSPSISLLPPPIPPSLHPFTHPPIHPTAALYGGLCCLALGSALDSARSGTAQVLSLWSLPVHPWCPSGLKPGLTACSPWATVSLQALGVVAIVGGADGHLTDGAYVWSRDFLEVPPGPALVSECVFAGDCAAHLSLLNRVLVLRGQSIRPSTPDSEPVEN